MMYLSCFSVDDIFDGDDKYYKTENTRSFKALK